MSNLMKSFCVFLFVSFCFPLVFAISFEFNLDKNIYEPGDIIQGSWVFDFTGNETFPLDVEFKVFFNNESFSVNETLYLNFTSYVFNLSQYLNFNDLYMPLEGGDFNFNFTVESEDVFFEYVSIVTLPLDIVSYFPNETVTEDLISLNVITNKNAECLYSVNSGMDYYLMEGSGQSHSKVLDVELEGEYFVNVKCNDSWNLNVELNFSFDRVVVLDALNIYDTSPSGYVDSESIKISFKTNRDAICRYSTEEEDFLFMDGMDSTNDTTHYKKLGDLDSGSNEYYIECRDLEGYSSLDKISFKIDREDPSVVLHSPRELIDYNRTINFKYTPKDDYGLRYCSLYLYLVDSWKKEKTNVIKLNNRVESFKVENLDLEEYGEYFWKVRCDDKAGNTVESSNVSFVTRKVFVDVVSSTKDTIGWHENLQAGDPTGPDWGVNDTVVVQDFNESESMSEYEDFSEDETAEQRNFFSFITGAAITDIGGSVGNFFDPFILVATILALFFIVGIRQYTERKLTKIPKRNSMKRANARLDTVYSQVFPSQNERLSKDISESPYWSSDANNSELAEHFHWKIMMARKRKYLSRAQLADALGETEKDIKMIEEGVLPRGHVRLIYKIERYLGVNLRK